MYAEKALRALLMQASAVTAIVGDRAYPVTLPQGCAWPALVLTNISTVPLQTLDAAAAYGLMRGRVQVTAMAATYSELKTLVAAVVAACNYQRGVIASVRVTSVVREFIGPDLRDDDRSVCTQSVDFVVTFQEP